MCEVSKSSRLRVGADRDSPSCSGAFVCVAVLMEAVYQDCLGGLGAGGYARRLCNGADISPSRPVALPVADQNRQNHVDRKHRRDREPDDPQPRPALNHQPARN